MTNLRFILRISCVLTLAGLCSCTYLIPEDPSAPRYNTVIGEKHRPARNSEGTAASPTPMMTPMAPGVQNMVPAIQTPVASAPVTPVMAMNLPPVDPAVQAKANMKIVADPALTAASTRLVPIENRRFQTAENTTDSGLMNVPPHPVNVGMNSPSARLGEARRELEQSRIESRTANEQLTQDAAQEPSMLPAAALPVATSAPVPQPSRIPAVALPETVRTPAPQASYIAPVNLTPPPVLSPRSVTHASPYTSSPAAPALPTSMVGGKSFDPMAPVAPAMKPIQLVSPAMPNVPVTASARAERPAVVSALPPTSSGFNPLAGASATGDATVGYLPASRYASRR